MKFELIVQKAAQIASMSFLCVTGPALATVMTDSRVEFVTSSLTTAGAVSRTSGSPIILSSAYAEGTPWYGYTCSFSGPGYNMCTATATVGHSYAQGLASATSDAQGLTLNAKASNDGGPGNQHLGRGPGFSEAWAMAFYEFKADATGSVAFSVDSDLWLGLSTSELGETARGWAFAGLQILSALPTVDPAKILDTPNAKFHETFLNGNYVFATDYYDEKLMGEAKNGDKYGNPLSPMSRHLTTTANVAAGDTFYLALSSYAGQAASTHDTNAVPEPNVLWLFSGGVALMGVAGARRRQRASFSHSTGCGFLGIATVHYLLFYSEVIAVGLF